MARSRVFPFGSYNVTTDKVDVSRRLATTGAIEACRMIQLDETGVEIEDDEFDPAYPGMTRVGFMETADSEAVHRT